jgi:hypothetical protein
MKLEILILTVLAVLNEKMLSTEGVCTKKTTTEKLPELILSKIYF